MSRLVLFGPGYAGSRIAAALRGQGWHVDSFGRGADRSAVLEALGRASHILSTVPPEDARDPVLDVYGAAIGALDWIGYLSSTGVYGDAGGGWVDEGTPLLGRRAGRIAADRDWHAIGACVLRLPGIYGPGRSMLDRLRSGEAYRVGLPEQVFSRIHVDDIVGGVIAAIGQGATGVFNLADDLPAAQDAVVAYGCTLIGLSLPPVRPVETLTPAARAFYGENRRVANGRAKRLLGWRPLHPTYRAGLASLLTPSSG